MLKQCCICRDHSANDNGNVLQFTLRLVQLCVMTSMTCVSSDSNISPINENVTEIER